MTNYEKILNMWNQFNIKTSEELDARLDSFRVLFAYNSGKIENPEITYYDTREVFENGKVAGFTGDPITAVEIINQKRAYGFLLTKIIEKEPVTTELIKTIHSLLTMATYDDRRFFTLNERPGEFKKTDFVVGRNEVGSMPENVSEDIAELLDEISKTTPQTAPFNILKTAAYFHARFENIHPFADGNGRTGRTLMNYFLLISNHPPLIVYEEDRIKYYTALEAFDTEEDLNSLIEFFQSQLEKTWEKTLQRRKEIFT